MPIHSIVVVTNEETTGNVQSDLIAETGHSMLAGLKLNDFFKRISSGMRPAIVQTKVNAVKSTGTVTLVSHLATHTVTVNGIVFTCVASGAVGDQYNVGGTDTLTAVNVAAVINANATLDGMVVATSSVNVVTITSLLPGEIGNAVTLAISAGGSVSAARMSGGTNGDAERTHNYGSAS